MHKSKTGNNPMSIPRRKELEHIQTMDYYSEIENEKRN
jgi:hypothetical protein